MSKGKKRQIRRLESKLKGFGGRKKLIQKEKEKKSCLPLKRVVRTKTKKEIRGKRVNAEHIVNYV